MPRSYHREYSKNYYHKRKNELIELLGGQCIKCGSKHDLQFDHKNPKLRKFKIGKLLNFKKEEVFKEVKKCQLLCRKCHTGKSVKEGSLSKNRGNKNPQTKLTEFEVIQILNSQESNRKLAEKFNVSSPNIWAIKNRKTWKYIMVTVV